MQQSQQQIKKKVKGITMGVLLIIALLCLTLFIFIRITDEIVLEKETGFDSKIFNILSQYTTASATKIMLLFTFFGSTKFLLPAYTLVTGYFLFYKRNLWKSINVSAIGLSSIGLLFLLKNIFRRHRPLQPLAPDVIGYSYPSGHSFSSFTFFGLLIYIIWQSQIKTLWKWLLSVVFFLMASAIAISRVYLHVHFASDVVAGFCLSIICLILSLWILDRIEKRFLNKKI